MKLNIRPATLSDAAYIFGLANDPQTRANSFHSQAIDWEGHLAWIKQKLKDPSSKIYLISKEDHTIGMVRFDKDAEVIIGVIVDPAYRGQGLAAHIIGLACREYRKTQPLDITAYIKNANVASVKAFEKAGFGHPQASNINGIDCLKLLAQYHDQL